MRIVRLTVAAAMLALSVLAVARASQVADDATNDAFVKWVRAQPESVTWDLDEELARSR